MVKSCSRFHGTRNQEKQNHSWMNMWISEAGILPKLIKHNSWAREKTLKKKRETQFDLCFFPWETSWLGTNKSIGVRNWATYLPLWVINFLSSLNGCVDGSDRLGTLVTLPFPFLAFGPSSSIMYFQPSIGLLRLNMWVLIKLAICK